MFTTCCRFTRLMALSIGGRLQRMRSIYKFFLIVIVVFWLLATAFQTTNNYQYRAIQRCYIKKNLFDKVTVRNVQMLEDVTNAFRKPKKDKTIFFHEIQCSSSGLVELTARQACAIESAARAHPDYDVFVLFASPVGIPRESQTQIPRSQIVETVREMPNVFFRNVNMWDYARNTPVDEWIHEAYPGVFSFSNFKENMADFMRFLSLYKYGGISLNQDVIVKKLMAPLGTNYVGLDREETILTAVMSLNSSANGHSVADILLKEFTKSFQFRTVLNGHGEDTINYVLRKLCNAIEGNQDTANRCSGVNLLAQSVFYPIREVDWKMLFDGNVADFVHEASTSSYAVHFWERQSTQRRLAVQRTEDGQLVNPKADLPAYLEMAAQFCPSVYEVRGLYF